MSSDVGHNFRRLAATIWWEGRTGSMEAAAREILRRSCEPRLNSRPLAEVCMEMAGPVPLIMNAEAIALATKVMAGSV
jgi:hypothetical protein